MAQGRKINFQEILTLDSLEEGLKKLKKKNKYKDYNSLVFSKRYLKNKDKKENGLKIFLEKYLDEEHKINKVALVEFYKNLKDFSFRPYNALAIEKGKTNPKKFRPLLVPEPKDRLVFDSLFPIYFEKLKIHLVKRKLLGLGLEKKQKISNILYEIFNNYINKGYNFALTLDYSSFFSLIDRKILLEKLETDLDDDKLLSIIDIIINNEIKNGEAVQEKTGVKILENGIPQGLSFSPLLACYYALNIDDVYINDPKVVGFRYVDDIIVFGKTKSDLKCLYKKIEDKSKELKMCLHPLGTKTELKDLRIDHVKYLGVEISASGLKISDDKFDDFLNIIKNEIFHPNNINSKKIESIKEVYLSFIKGWLNHYEKISKDKFALHQKINNLLYDNFFSKKRNRKAFYIANPWIKII